jgi:hypothetical protein
VWERLIASNKINREGLFLFLALLVTAFPLTAQTVHHHRAKPTPAVARALPVDSPREKPVASVRQTAGVIELPSDKVDCLTDLVFDLYHCC